ncbi:hypothetical protein J6590_054579 [Homalodisca vitripennis]|nr:hypothetical protein J6590_054579 [Homalodisca vitripennis]
MLGFSWLSPQGKLNISVGNTIHSNQSKNAFTRKRAKPVEFRERSRYKYGLICNFAKKGLRLRQNCTLQLYCKLLISGYLRDVVGTRTHFIESSRAILSLTPSFSLSLSLSLSLSVFL